MRTARPSACPSPSRPGLLRAVAGVAVLIAVTVLPACGAGGAGGGDGGGAPPAVSIQTATLPTAGLNVAYTTVLTASGGDAPYAWALASGSALPPGLGLSGNGTISGAATALGTFVFSVVVSDAGSPAQSDSATYQLTVSMFDASISMLRFGEAWTGETYPVSAVGAASTTFTLVQNQSGGAILGANPGTSTATYKAGPTPGTDRIRATSGSGATEDIDVLVQANPVANMTASFSGTDVWHVRFDGKFDASHPYVSDFHWALVTIGMRASTSVGTTGTTADEIASLYVRQQVLRHLNLTYLRSGDGSKGASGLKISFPFEEPDAPHVSPADGTVSSPALNQFNVVSVISGGDPGVLGTAFVDSTSNGYQENNTTTTGGALGVFLDELTPIFNAAFNNKTLTAAPVGAGDVAALKALLYGTTKPAASRYDELQRIAEGFGRTVAWTLAHEVGHSLGLVHTPGSPAGSIMNAGASISPYVSYAFIAGDVSILQGDLPGPGRGGSPLRVDALRIAGPGEGDDTLLDIEVCGSCRCHHRR